LVNQELSFLNDGDVVFPDGLRRFSGWFTSFFWKVLYHQILYIPIILFIPDLFFYPSIHYG
ncbi:MAG TPA: hypothetical protein PLL35_03735, partial [Candidatus Cloacimonas sp.]|nr:hypothetical protein [Candidatus Cloacimonas sp.]